MDTLKRCTKCDQSKPLSEYSLTPAGHPRGSCKSCRSVANIGVEARSRKLKYKYGITHNDYLSLLEEQDGKCLGCGGLAEDQHHGVLDVDHNHKTNEVRGLLCGSCNRLMGFAGDNARVLRNLANYLEDRGSYGEDL